MEDAGLEGIGRDQRVEKDWRELERIRRKLKGIRGKWTDWRGEELIGGKGRQ